MHSHSQLYEGVSLVEIFTFLPVLCANETTVKTDGPVKRVSFCNCFLKFTHHGTSVLDNIFFTNEAWVLKSGYINSQNCHTWSDNLTNMLNPVFILKRLAFGFLFHGKGLLDQSFFMTQSMSNDIKISVLTSMDFSIFIQNFGTNPYQYGFLHYSYGISSKSGFSVDLK